MKNLLFLLLLPCLVFGQTEKDQKTILRNGSSTTPTTSSSQSQVSQKVEIRNNSTYQSSPTLGNNSTYYQPKTTTNYRPRPHWDGYTRWNRWGAPYSYRNYYEYQYLNRYGVRTPYRIYEYFDGTKDTIVSKKKKIRFGVNMSTKNEIGGWFTIGRSVYFKAQFDKTLYTDESTFYSNITMDIVQSWVTSNPSQNYKLDNITQGWSLYLGVGKEFKNFGANISLGFGYEKDNFQYFDGLYILSNNGKYSFKNFVDNYTTLSFGLTHDYKFLSLSADYDPIRNNFYLGVGFNF